MVSQLDFFIEDILNPKILKVEDSSWYNPDVPVTEARLEVQYPGFAGYVIIPVARGFDYTINTNILGITNVTTSTLLSDLPDGLWTIKYSICPNNELFVEYTFLRNTKQLVKYYNLYCGLEITKCNRKDYECELKKLREIKMKIDAAKYLADCCKYSQAIELYDYIDDLLTEFSSSCKCYGNC